MIRSRAGSSLDSLAASTELASRTLLVAV